ncbi:MAG: ribonuclease HII [Oscillospiraceae bacterium]|jgi:ribonuclease HII|nr:ribonuclease HII [Oscillospiraceae bacterium]
MEMQFADQLFAKGMSFICGVDEAGRGPLAGPVCVAAAILPRVFDLPFLDDSKRLSAGKREDLFGMITQQALDFKIVFVDEKTIDEVNILQATMRGMQDAVCGLKTNPDLVLVDGNKAPQLPFPVKCIVHGDSKVPAIAAASILAKVTRDRFMIERAKEYPGYLFEKNKGYGTAAHMAAIAHLGLCGIHRRSFCKKLIP